MVGKMTIHYKSKGIRLRPLCKDGFILWVETPEISLVECNKCLQIIDKLQTTVPNESFSPSTDKQKLS